MARGLGLVDMVMALIAYGRPGFANTALFSLKRR
jgi:hypothetical protein